MALLYVNSKGSAWRKHSYSAGNDFDSSPYKYYLKKILGWKEKDNKARLKFGRALEEAIQFHHDNGTGGVEDFLRRWETWKDEKDLVFTKVEKDWVNLNRIGHEMMRLYLLRLPSLPIPLGGQTVFQREYCREVFPGDPNYGEIEDAGKMDIIAYVQPDHPMLPKVEWKAEYGPLRSVIVDIKTSGIDFPETPGIAAFDKQLRRYSWLTDIRDVALLWFKKTGTSLSKGSSVTLLEDGGFDGFRAGDEAVVAHIGSKGVWLVRNDYFLTVMEDAQGRKEGRLDTTKIAVERKAKWLYENGIVVPESYLTRQRIQFNAGLVTKESAEEAGLIAARQIVQIVNAWKTKQWPNNFGIRFPSDDSRDPYFRAFVLGDTMYRDQNFIKTKEETLDDLFIEDLENVD